MHKLFLDDIREPYDDSWTVVRTPKEFKDAIRAKMPDIVSFDHDLAAEHYSPLMNDEAKYNSLSKTFKHETGLDLAKWMCVHCSTNGLALPEVRVHSYNPVGAKNIAYYITDYSLFHYDEEINIQPKPYGFEKRR